MLITRKEARNMDNQKLAAKATEFANGFANKLGINEKVEITPEEVVFDKDYAKERIAAMKGSVIPTDRFDTVYPIFVEQIEERFINASSKKAGKELQET